MKNLSMIFILLFLASCSKDLPPLNAQCLKDAETDMMDTQYVKGVSLEQDGSNLKLLIATNEAINEDDGQSVAFKYVNAVRVLCGDKKETRKGKTFGTTEYSYEVFAFGENSGKRSAHGIKNAGGENISWLKIR